MDISFIIPVRNDAAGLRRCLTSIADNGYPQERIEAIVIDNGSTDDSAAAARAAGAHVIAAPAVCVAEMRNIGAAAARSPILAFVDADHELAGGWIAAAVENLDASSPVGATGSLCRAPEDGTWVQRAYERLRGRHGTRTEVEWLGAGNMAVRRDAFLRIGGFNSTLETCEDVDLCKRLRAGGFHLLNDERMRNVHLGDPATLRALFKGELWRGRSNLAVSFRPPVTARELPSVLIPMVQLAGLAVAVTALVAFGIGGVIVAALALAPLAAVPILRSVRMATRGGTGVRDFAGNAAVALVYDLARAFALIAFARHQTRRS